MKNMQEQDINVNFQAAISQLANKLEELLQKNKPNIRANKLFEIISDNNYMTSNEITDNTKKEIISTVNDMGDENKFRENIKTLGHMFTGKQDRICDSLAKILSGRSECVAIVMFGGVLHVSANEVHNTTTGKEIQENFATIKNFLKSKKTYKVKYNNEILDTICPHESFQIKLKKGASIFTENSYLAARKFVEEHGKVLNYDEIKLAKGVGYNAGVVGHMTIDINEQEENLRKVTYYYNTHTNFSQKILNATWIYDSAEEYYKIDKKKYTKVHAEMVALGKTIQWIEKKISRGSDALNIYIGISKSCCFHCHHTIEAANKILADKGYNVKISYRQYHDFSFNKEITLDNSRWDFPLTLQKGDLGEAITAEANKTFGARQPKTKNVIQTHTEPSDSIESSSDDGNYHDQYKELTESLNDLNIIIKRSKKFPDVMDAANRNLEQIQFLLNLWDNKICAIILHSLIKKENKDIKELKIKLLELYNEMKTFSNKDLKNLYACLIGKFSHENIRNSFKLVKEESLPTLEQALMLVLSRNPSMKQKVAMGASNIKTTTIAVDRSRSNTINMPITSQTTHASTKEGKVARSDNNIKWSLNKTTTRTAVDTKFTTTVAKPFKPTVPITNILSDRNQDYKKDQFQPYINNMVRDNRNIFGENVENITEIVNLVRKNSVVSKYLKSTNLRVKINAGELYDNLLNQLKNAGHKKNIDAILDNILKNKTLVGEILSKLFQNLSQDEEIDLLLDLYSPELGITQEKSGYLSTDKLPGQQQIKHTQTTTNPFLTTHKRTNKPLDESKKHVRKGNTVTTQVAPKVPSKSITHKVSIIPKESTIKIIGKREREGSSTSSPPTKKIKIEPYIHTTPNAPANKATTNPTLSLFGHGIQTQPNLYTIITSTKNKEPIPKNISTVSKNDDKLKH